MYAKILLPLASLLLLSTQAPNVNSYKILAVYAFPGKSHFMMHTALIRELIAHGHEVTMISAFPLASHNLGDNYTEILVEPAYDFWADVKQVYNVDSIFELTSMNVFDFLSMLQLIGMKTTEHALKQPKIQAIINANETKGVYDLLLTEQFYQEAFLALAHVYNIPVVSTTTLGQQNYMSQMMGTVTPWSFVPHGFLPFTDRMSFFERLQNSFYSLYEDLHREFEYFPNMDGLVEKYFVNTTVKIPKVSQMEKNISVMLLNSHVPLITARPLVNGMIPVGGMHIYPPKPLPADIQEFLDEAPHGVIYFSLGSNVQSNDMPKEYLRIFLEVFAGLKQRILWKFEDENISGLPSNIMIKKWLPQSDILAHPKTVIFITHGGLFSTQEGVHHGVPMLGMPVYCDQHLNMNKAVQGGYAISLHFQAVTKDVLQRSLKQLLENESYNENVKRVSRIFRDRQVDSRETAVFWTEYVIRHSGASHLRSAGLDLQWYQFYLLDVIAFVIFAVVLVSVVLVKLVWQPLRQRISGNYTKKSRKPKLQ